MISCGAGTLTAWFGGGPMTPYTQLQITVLDHPYLVLMMAVLLLLSLAIAVQLAILARQIARIEKALGDRRINAPVRRIDAPME